MIILNDIHKWVRVPNEDGIVFANTQPRPVTLDFNVDGEASIYIIINDDKDPVFLSLVRGRQTVKFVTPGRFLLVNKTVDVDAYVLSRDSTKVHRVAVDEEVFTTLHEPRTVDPDVQRMLDNINRNVSRRMAAQAEQYERMLANERERANNAPATTQPVQAPVGDGTTGKTSGGAGEPDDSAGTTS